MMVLGLLVRVWPLPHEAVDGDELFSERVAVASIPAAYVMVRDDLVHPPLYYFILKPVVAVLGTGALALRLLSLLAGILTIPLVWLLGKRLDPGESDATGLLAAAIVALSRFDIYYSQEARSYSFYVLLIVLLALWIGSVTRQTSRLKWAVGFLLMLGCLYIHYVGAIFLALAVSAFCITRTDRIIRLRVFFGYLAAVLLFFPWLYVVRKAYHLQHGAGTHLTWQAVPTFYDVRQIWALSLGVIEMKGGTALVLAIIFLLSVAAVAIPGLRNLLRNRLLLMSLALGILPPPIMFVLARPPFNLSIFALRHILPSTVFLCLVCCYGLVVLARSRPRYTRLIYISGSLVLLAFATIPTASVLLHEPSRFPYDRIEQQVADERSHGIPAYATWFYGIGEPVNFYCHADCVSAFDGHNLPAKFLFLYRPDKDDDRRVYADLLQSGFVPSGSTFYTTGDHNPLGTSVVMIEHRP